MPAPGGPATQSGIGFQDAVAALYLGRLCDHSHRPPPDIVREVRVETSGCVDDIELLMGDDSRRWMNVKEQVGTSSEEWRAIWRGFLAKRGALDETRGDRLALWLGSSTKAQDMLAEASKRARHARDAAEWWADLSRDQQAAVDAIGDLIAARGERPAMLGLLRVVDFDIVSRERLRDRVPYWMPRCRSTTPEALYEVLQSKAVAGARYRRTFTRADLVRDLREIGIDVLSAWPGIDEYRSALERETETIAIPGTKLGGAIDAVFREPRVRAWRLQDAEANDAHDIDDLPSDDAGAAIPFDSLLVDAGDRVVVLGGAGSGKSTLVTVLANRACRAMQVPAIVRLVDLANSRRSVVAFLTTRINERHAASVDWQSLCEDGSALLLFDGLDELPQQLRSTTLDEIAAFSARFPHAPWIMTARDMASTVPPAAARVVEVLPLAADDREAFVRGWLPAERQHLAAEIARKVSCSRELQRMARVPFLLALIIANVSADHDPLPARRSDLLDRYIGILLRPEKHKPSCVEVDAVVLRAAAEALAFAGLEADNPDLSARQAAGVVAGAEPQSTLDALVQCGLLRESQDRYRFVFPTLQEYLAGFFIATARQSEIVPRFERHASRPWMQALQFAVEVSDNADPIVADLLGRPDDAFRTTLKLLGRCVANGARVLPHTRARVGDALAARWIAEDRQGRWTGELIADGFAKALPANAVSQLKAGKQLDFGGAAILVAADDPTLTESALRAKLAVGFPGHVVEWQPAIDRIAPTAARLYLDRATVNRTDFPVREVQWLAYLLRQVSEVSCDDDPRVAFAEDEVGAPILRLACLLRLGSSVPDDAERLVVDSFRQYVATETEGDSPAFDVVVDAMFRLPHVIQTWRTCLALLETTPLHAKATDWWLRGLGPVEAYWRMVVSAITPRMGADDARVHVRELGLSAPLTQSQRDYLDLTLAYLGDDGAFSDLSARVDALHIRDLTRWAYLAGSGSATVVSAALQRLRGLGGTHRVEASMSLGFALSYEVELMRGLSGVARGVRRRRHPSADEAIVLLRSWADEAASGSAVRFACLAQAVNLGDIATANALIEQIRERAQSRFDHETGSRMADALRAVGSTSVPISSELLARLARVNDRNLASTSYALLVRARSGEALDRLLALHADASDHAKRLIAGHIERLAHALGVRVVADARGGLSRSAT